MFNIIPAPLINDFKNENVVILIGSGMSCNANLPQWSDLLNSLQHKLLNLDHEESIFFESLENTQKAQFIYDKTNKISVINTVKDIFERSKEFSEPHKLLVILPVKMLITTNWDNLIEYYFEHEIKTNISVIWKDEQLPLIFGPNLLIKLHGTLQEPSSVIFSEEDYLSFLNSDTLLKQYISTIIATSTLLFLGYSFSDFDFKILVNYVRGKTKTLNQKPYIFLPNGEKSQIEYLEKRGLIPIVFHGENIKKAATNFLSQLSNKVSITAIDSIDRLKILYRENSSMLNKASHLIIRNQANLGPLATPINPKNISLFGNKEKTKLEIECATTWRKLLENGAIAKCIICIDKIWILERYEAKDVLERLKTLKENISHYSSCLEIVDIGMPIRTNLDIYGKEVCLESIKVGHQVKSYNKLKVIRRPDQIYSLIQFFDKTFEDIKRNNLLLAKQIFPNFRGKTESLLKKYIVYKLEDAINEVAGK